MSIFSIIVKGQKAKKKEPPPRDGSIQITCDPLQFYFRIALVLILQIIIQLWSLQQG